MPIIYKVVGHNGRPEDEYTESWHKTYDLALAEFHKFMVAKIVSVYSVDFEKPKYTTNETVVLEK